MNLLQADRLAQCPLLWNKVAIFRRKYADLVGIGLLRLNKNLFKEAEVLSAPPLSALTLKKKGFIMHDRDPGS